MKDQPCAYISVFLKIEDFLAIALKGNGFWKKFLLFITRIIEWRIGTETFISVPEEMHNVTSDRLEIARLVSALIEDGWSKSVGKVRENYLNYSDEPYPYTARVSPQGFGCDFFSSNSALWKAFGENVERYIWLYSDSFYKGDTIKSSYKKLPGKALDIFALSGFTHDQKLNHERIRFDENTNFTWTQAHSLTKKSRIFCPLQLVSRKHVNETDEPMLRWSISTGLATGKTMNEAVLTGMLEVIERDAFMISYLNKLSPPLVDLDHFARGNKQVREIMSELKTYRLIPHVVVLPTDFPVFVALSILTDPTGLGPRVCVGARASFDPATSIIDSLTESVFSRLHSKESYDENIRGKPIQRSERLRYWAQEKDLDKINFLLSSKKIQVDNKRVVESTSQKIEILVKRLNGKEYDACFVELSNPTLKKMGVESVMVVIPELQPMHLDESIPYFGGERLQSIPETLGYTSAKVINTIPHPFP